MQSVKILRVEQFRERDFAVFYTDEYGVPRLEYRLDKNHEMHAVNGFIKDMRQQLNASHNFEQPWIVDERTNGTVELFIAGRKVYEGAV